jgi:hypothetical protein
MTDKTKKVLQNYCPILRVAAIAAFLLAPTTPQDAESVSYTARTANVQENVNSEQESEVTGVLVPDNSYKMRVTGFSSVECHTTWCKANAGQPRGQKIALNAKYGKVSKVYIAAYDKTYDVIGTTDQNTDADVWFGDDQQTALEHGAKNLLVTLIK